MRGHAADFFSRRPLADAMDGQGLAGRGGAREPSSRTNRLHPLHPARALGPASNVNSEADCKNDTAPGGGMRWSQSTPPRLSPPSVECRPPLRWGPLCQLPDRLTAGINLYSVVLTRNAARSLLLTKRGPYTDHGRATSAKSSHSMSTAMRSSAASIRIVSLAIRVATHKKSARIDELVAERSGGAPWLH